MQSDAKSISETGGGAPIGQQFAAPAAPLEEKFTIPGYGGPEEAVFTPEHIPTQPTPGAPLTMTPEKGTSRSTKLIAIALGSIVLVAGLGVLGYYFVYPLVFPAAVVQEPPLPPPPPPPVAEIPPAPPAPIAVTHKSFLTKAADKVERIAATPSTLTATSIRTGITAAATVAAGEKPASGSLKEIYFANDKDETAGFVNLVKAAIPELGMLETQFSQLFEEDFTGFLYYDGASYWPGYIAKLKSGANDILAKTAVSEVEKYPESLKNFFLTDPGAPNGTFKDGQVNGHPGRYLTYTQQNAAFDMVWLDNYLLIATNYTAALEAATRLGYPKQ